MRSEKLVSVKPGRVSVDHKSKQSAQQMLKKSTKVDNYTALAFLDQGRSSIRQIRQPAVEGRGQKLQKLPGDDHEEVRTLGVQKVQYDTPSATDNQFNDAERISHSNQAITVSDNDSRQHVQVQLQTPSIHEQASLQPPANTLSSYLSPQGKVPNVGLQNLNSTNYKFDKVHATVESNKIQPPKPKAVDYLSNIKKKFELTATRAPLSGLTKQQQQGATRAPSSKSIKQDNSRSDSKGRKNIYGSTVAFEQKPKFMTGSSSTVHALPKPVPSAAVRDKSMSPARIPANIPVKPSPGESLRNLDFLRKSRSTLPSFLTKTDTSSHNKNDSSSRSPKKLTRPDANHSPSRSPSKPALLFPKPSPHKRSARPASPAPHQPSNDSHSPAPSVSSTSSASASSQKLLQKIRERSEIAHNSFKINLQDLIKVDEIYVDILTRKSFDQTFESFDVLKTYLINQYCFILTDLNLLFCNEKFREVMRINYLKEVLYFVYIYILLVKNRFEFAGLQKSLMQAPGRVDSEYVKSYIVSINKETEDLMLQVLSYIHIVFIFRAEIFLDRATVYYQNHKMFRKLQLLLSKRKSKFNVSSARRENYEDHIIKINRYLDLCEQALQELFKLNPSFGQISQFLVDSLVSISKRTGELKIDDFNRVFREAKIQFDGKGISEFCPELLLHDSVVVFESDLGESRPTAPFVREPPKAGKKLTLILDLDETLIHYPEEHLKDLETKVNVEHVKVRPHAVEFLQQMALYFELGIFTAASQNYADPIIDLIDPNRLVSHRLYRQHLTLHNGKLIKDLSKIGRDLSKLIMLDNLPENYILQPENGVYVKSWLGDQNDKCLMLLMSVFVYVATNAGEDVRTLLLEFKNILVESIK